MLERLRGRIIEMLGGYPSADAVPADLVIHRVTVEAFAAHVRMRPAAERHALLTLAVRRLFNTIGPGDILRIDETNRWWWKGRLLPEGQVTMLQAEAKALFEGKLWEILSAEVVYKANKSIYQQSEDIPDLVAGKMLLYYKDIVETRLKQML